MGSPSYSPAAHHQEWLFTRSAQGGGKPTNLVEFLHEEDPTPNSDVHV